MQGPRAIIGDDHREEPPLSNGHLRKGSSISDIAPGRYLYAANGDLESGLKLQIMAVSVRSGC